MPKPIMPNVSIENIAKELSRSVSIKSKGKYLPTVHSVVGIEDMEPSKIYENVSEVVRAVGAKVGQNNIRSVYVKLTMSKPMKFM
jgi:large subunit ribosomal protein L1